MTTDGVTRTDTLTREDSDQIIQLFSEDAGDYRGMDKKLPHIGQRKIREHLTFIFKWMLDKILSRVKQ